MATRPTRRTQAERREATRTALLEATIECLVTYGYAGTSTTRVADAAGVSRGAQVHYFASKGELVAAAVEHLAHRRMDELRERMATLPAGRDRIATLLDILWETHTSEAFDATLELWVAARTDDELRPHLAALEKRVAEDVGKLALEVLPEEARRPRFRQDLELAMATARGLALLRFASGDNSRAVQRRWRETRERLVTLIASG